MNLNEDLAEFVGAMLGDGCLYLAKGRNRTRRVAILTGHIKNDYLYYEMTIRPIIIKNFENRGYLTKRIKYNALVLVMSHSIYDFLKSLDFPTGKKREIKIPVKIFLNQRFAIACVRGIFDTDGSIYRKYSKMYEGHKRIYEGLTIEIKLNSKYLIEQINSVLAKESIKTNKITNYKKAYRLRITDQKHIDKFMKVIAPNNMYHLERYLNRCQVPYIKGP